MIKVRHELHQIPEGEFECYNTFEKVKSTLLSLGINENQIKKMASTGLTVDIRGKAEENESGECKGLAFRADMDGL